MTPALRIPTRKTSHKGLSLRCTCRSAGGTRRVSPLAIGVVVHTTYSKGSATPSRRSRLVREQAGTTMCA